MINSPKRGWYARLSCLLLAVLLPFSTALAAAPRTEDGADVSPAPSAAATSAAAPTAEPSAADTQSPAASSAISAEAAETLSAAPAASDASETTASSLSPAASRQPSASPAASAAAPASTHTLNTWIVPLHIDGWEVGQSPNKPVAQARYGTPVFYYGQAGGTFTTNVPKTAGAWICRAYVPAGEDYSSLSAEVTFTISKAPGGTEIPQDLTAIYRSVLGNVRLPAGFSWERPSALLSQNVGVHEYPATYTGNDQQPVSVNIPVRITPAPGDQCYISPITNEAQAESFRVTSGTYTLHRGVDYTSTMNVKNGTATVTIHFIGNFYGEVVRTFAIDMSNRWLVPLSMGSWVEGETPASPSAKAEHGIPVYTYLVDGAYQSERPVLPGTYKVRAEVAPTDFYDGLEAETAFTIYPSPDKPPVVEGLTAVYRSTLSQIKLPDGYAWAHPSELISAGVGLHDYRAIYTRSDGSAVSVELPVQVEPAPGSRCTISPIHNEAEARNIVITDGTFRLSNGVDYTVTSAVSGNLVTVTVHFIGNYTGQATRTFTFGTTNTWTVPLSMADWTEGEVPSEPVAEAKYGEPVFTYYDGTVRLAGRPDTPGTYTVVATVPATIYYPALTASVKFTVYPKLAAEIPMPEGLTAVYRTALDSVRLPDGFTWAEPDTLITQDVGDRTYPAIYTEPRSHAEPVRVDLTVKVIPAPAGRLTISPVTNEAEARHIVITDGSYTLVRGTDYTVASTVKDNLVTVTITFEGNYTGKVERTFTYSFPNEWTVPLTIADWCVGQTPARPHAEAKYGTPEFAYLVDGTYRTEPPTEAGTYTVRAVVPASAYYTELEATATFTIYAALAPDVPEQMAVYGQKLKDITLPEGFTWNDPDDYVGNVGTHTFPASYKGSSEYLGGTVSIDVKVGPCSGELCTISPITNEYEGRHVVITYQGVTLVKGVDYTVTSEVEGNRVTVSIHFQGNFTGTVERTFRFAWDNYWIEQPSIADWAAGQTPSKPRGQAEYGLTAFSYLVNGTYKSEQPTTPGTYEMRAVVPATDNYRGLEATVTFTIFDAVAPEVNGLHAVYGEKLSDVALPEGFAWNYPSDYVGNVGVREFPARYRTQGDRWRQRAETYLGGEVDLDVRVTPRSGALCTISPIENEYDGRNITITDQGVTLVKGRDYTVSSSVKGNVVTVTIHFEGNYYGTVTRTFEFHGQNEWVVPLSIQNWIYGENPSVPIASPKYGTAVFTYLVDGKYQDAPPVNAGKYTVRATVAGTVYYDEIEATAPFEILPAAAPAPEGLTAVYRDQLRQVKLPDGYRWQNPGDYVGDAGEHTFPAIYTPEADGNYAAGTVQAAVRVDPMNGALCDISPITDQYEANHVVITTGDYTLKAGTDYTVKMHQSGSIVEVEILFQDNFYGSVRKSFALAADNYWVVPLSMASWTEGETPSKPQAEARYGTPVYTYASSAAAVHDSPEEPTAPGTYYVRAQVAATDTYNGLDAIAPFTIYPAPAVPTTSSAPAPSQTAASSATQTTVPTATASATAAPSETAEPSVSASATIAPSASATRTAVPTATASATAAPSETAEPSVTASATAAPSETTAPSASASPTTTPSASATQTAGPTATASATAVPSETAAPSATISATAEPTATASATAAPSETAEPSGTASAMPTLSAAPTASASVTAVPSATASPSATGSATAAASASTAPSAAPSTSAVPSTSCGPTATASVGGAGGLVSSVAPTGSSPAAAAGTAARPSSEAENPPRTDDASSIWLWISLFALSAGAGIWVSLRQRRREDKTK